MLEFGRRPFGQRQIACPSLPISSSKILLASVAGKAEGTGFSAYQLAGCWSPTIRHAVASRGLARPGRDNPAHLAQPHRALQSPPKETPQNIIWLDQDSHCTMSGNNKSIRDFFRPAQTVMQKASLPKAASSGLQNSTFKTPLAPISKSQSIQPVRASSKAQELRGYTSSLSPPSGSDDLNSSPSPTAQSPPAAPLSHRPSTRVVRSSDDEDSDSDSELADLEDIFQLNNSSKGPASATRSYTPSTPSASRHKDIYNFHLSPLAVLPKYQFDLKSLVSQAEAEKATEASSKRIKDMLATKDDGEDSALFADEKFVNPVDLSHGSLLESLVPNKEDGGMQKVSRALERTETTSVEKCWYFFSTNTTNPPNPKRKPFPSSSVKSSWGKEFSTAKTRNQSFVSGFVEDMVVFGKVLPDELFLWILDEACLETDDILRNAYFKTLKGSVEHISRLLSPQLVETMFLNLGGTPTATTPTEKIKPSTGLTEPYLNREWAILRCVVQFFAAVADCLQQRTREHIICLLLRMSIDHVVARNVDLLDMVQEAIRRLCRHTPSESWDSCCQNVSKVMFDSVEQPSLRLKVVDTLPCVIPRTHDLRRRLAMCFYFDDLSYSSAHPQTKTNLNRIIERLDDPAFDANSQTDYRELAALVSILDIAVDDARTPNLDLTDKDTARDFDESVDLLVAIIKDVMRSIGNPGAAFISRIEAKEALELVSQRISDTLRSRPKPKLTHFDVKKEENLKGERIGMSAFLSKMKGSGSNDNGKTM
ncbi:hypothetical protein G7Y89_g2304 [Cudoniella acicularis]|uniref:Uncharacterized protein n=1 Tax=Cudoniella acicularis TaxID=354080 RepID=A0A8H4RWI4_9HELO|nr:hypothetical protein G7Y89_g2304 [Cudoniella acicularis]